MTILATIIVLGVLIFVHELGHFAAAKAVDIRVERFSIGLGPKVFGWTRGETEYVLSWIPLGGYVKMGGMDDEVMARIEGGETEVQHKPGERDFDGKPIWARALVLSAGVLMNFAFAFFAYTAVAAFWGSAEIDTRRLGFVAEEILPEGAAALADLPVGSEIIEVGDRPIQAWNDVGRAILDAPAGPLRVRTSDPSATVTIRLDEVVDNRRRVAGALSYFVPSAVGSVTPGGPAAEAGLRPGDAVTSVDGRPVRTWHELVREIRARPEQTLRFGIMREGQPLERMVTPAANRETDPTTGDEQVVGQIGVGIPADQVPVGYRPVPLGQSLVIGWQNTVGITGLMLGFLRDLFTGGVSPRSVGSIVAIGEMSGQAARQGLSTFLEFMALFSVNLAILNLLPIPILDGGHLVFLAIEAIRGKALSVEQRIRASQVGLVIVMGIMILALSNDIRRLFGF